MNASSKLNRHVAILGPIALVFATCVTPSLGGVPRSENNKPRVASTKWCRPPTTAREFQEFVARCEREKLEYRLSLKQLAREVEAAQRQGEVSKALRYLKGFNWFIGFVIVDRGRDDGDVLLIGMYDPSRSPMDVDCLATAFKVLTEPGQVPACSLEQDRNPSYQRAVVMGVPWTSTWAEIMISADYRMKELAQGAIQDRNLKSFVSRKIMSMKRGRARGLAAGEENRWWFTRPADDQKPRSVILARGEGGDGAHSADILLMTRNPVALLTEKQIHGEYGTGVTAVEARQFASEFTRSMDQVGKRHRSIGDLLALYRLLDVMAHLKGVGRVNLPGEDFWLKGYQTDSKGPPKKVPTLERSVFISSTYSFNGVTTHTLSVAGGVRMPVGVDSTSIPTELVQDLKQRVLEDKPKSCEWAMDPAPGYPPESMTKRSNNSYPEHHGDLRGPVAVSSIYPSEAAMR